VLLLLFSRYEKQAEQVFDTQSIQLLAKNNNRVGLGLDLGGIENILSFL
jgi:hypothetical protein